MTTLTVYFDGQFWVGVCERNDETGYAAAKVVFGAEPDDQELFTLVTRDYDRFRFSDPVAHHSSEIKKISPKRIQRQISRTLSAEGVCTKAQQAIKAEQEKRAAEKKKTAKQQKEQSVQQKFDLRMQKKKKKHRGR